MSRDETVTLPVAEVHGLREYKDLAIKLSAENDSLKATNGLVESLELENDELRRRLAAADSHEPLTREQAFQKAQAVVSEWIGRRSVPLHRDLKFHLIDALADAFGSPVVKEAQGIS